MRRVFHIVERGSVFESVNERYIDAINRFAEFAKKHRIKVVMVPPPYRAVNRAYSLESLRSVYETCRRRCHIAVLSDPGNYLFENNQYFEGDFHLGALGREERTDRLIRDLSNYLRTCNDEPSAIGSCNRSIVIDQL